MEQSEDTCPEVPSIFVDKDVLNCTFKMREATNKFYTIGQEVFYEDPELKLQNEFVQFELYAQKRCNVKGNEFIGNASDDEYFWTPNTSSDDESSTNDEILKTVVRTVPDGIVINNEVYLTLAQWNTIVHGEDGIVHCVICNKYMNLNYISHINTSDHQYKHDTHQPLARFELSITRLIRNVYHCGVCNTVIDIKNEKNHFDSKNHEDKLLFAMDRVSEYPVNDINGNNERKINETVINDNDSKYLNDNENSEKVKEVAVNAGVSYANTLKKQNVLPEYIEVDLGSKRVRVTYDCWHMIGKLKKNSIYCMACSVTEHVILKKQHCEGQKHINNLKKFPVVLKYEKHFIRKVDHFYHCGHCNSLQVEEGIEDHLLLKHSRNRPISENLTSNDNLNDIAKINIVMNSDPINDVVKANNDKAIAVKNKKSFASASDANKSKVLQSYADFIVLNLFNYKITLPFLHYNVIINQPWKIIYCGLCNVNFSETNIPILAHTQSTCHIQQLQIIPFMPEWGFNMIRNIRGFLHCALCNVLLIQNLIRFHIQEPAHLKLLQNIQSNNISNTAEGSLSPTPTINTNNDKTIKSNDKTKECLKESYDDMLNESLDDTLESVVDLDGFVYVRPDNIYHKISLMSYNALVPKGDGNRYCFVCSTNVNCDAIKKHIERRDHMKNIDECKFVDLHKGTLLRQMYTKYQCCVCNILMAWHEMKDHLAWPKHAILTEESIKVSKKARKLEVKDGTPVIFVKLVKQQVFEQTKHVPNVLFNVKVVKVEKVVKYKLIFVDEKVFKIPLVNWHGIFKAKDGEKCLVCQILISRKWQLHVKEKDHLTRIQNCNLNDHLPELLRKINNSLVHCIICNVEMPNVNNIISIHIEGKNHKKNGKAIQELSSQANTYTDCDNDILHL